MKPTLSTSRAQPGRGAVLRIAFFAWADAQTGTYYRYHNLARGLVARGHAVTVYSQNYERRGRATRALRDGVAYELAPCFPGNRFVAFARNPANRLARYLAPVAPADVFHLFQPIETGALAWNRLRRARRHRGALFAWDWDDLWEGGLCDPSIASPRGARRARQHGRLERSLPRAADLVTACSEFLARLAEERGTRRAGVVANGFWPEESASAEVRAAERARLGLSPDILCLGFFGWTPAEANWCLDLLRAAREVFGPRVRLLCGGHDLRPMLADCPELAAQVDYAGELSPAAARRLMGAVDLGLLPLADTPFNRSRLPIKFAESLAAGRPLLCGTVGEVARLGRELAGAILAPPERGGWAEAGVAALRCLDVDAAWGRPDPAQLAARLGWDVLAAELERLYLVGLAESRSEEADAGPKIAQA